MLFPAGKLGRKVVFPVGKTDFGKNGICIKRILTDLGSKLYIFSGGQVLYQIVKLEYKADVVAAISCQPLTVKGADTLSVQKDRAYITRIHSAEHV